MLLHWEKIFKSVSFWIFMENTRLLNCYSHLHYPLFWGSQMLLTGFPGVSDSKESCRRQGFDPWVGKIPPEKGMATHSSILAWRIPWTEEPGGLRTWFRDLHFEKIWSKWKAGQMRPLAFTTKSCRQRGPIRDISCPLKYAKKIDTLRASVNCLNLIVKLSRIC